MAPHQMIDVRIVCTHDAVKLAEMLTRLLEAEEHRVRLTYGRQAMLELEDARQARDAVLLIWSPDARSQSYMLEWARNIEPSRLIEIARGATDYPPVKRLAAVIDFSQWRGQRGARAWKALTERLSTVTRALSPHAPVPAKAIWAVGVATAAAMAGAVAVRVNAPLEGVPVAPLENLAVAGDDIGVGGALTAIEPASFEDEVIRLRHFPELAPLDMTPSVPLAQVAVYEEQDLRDPTMLERIDGAISLFIPRGDESAQ
jgi:hypothetical protein